LPSDQVTALAAAPGDGLWLGTSGGLARYRPDRTPPRVRILRAVTDTVYEAPRRLDLDRSGHPRLVTALALWQARAGGNSQIPNARCQRIWNQGGSAHSSSSRTGKQRVYSSARPSGLRNALVRSAVW